MTISEIAPSVYQIKNTFVFQYLVLNNSKLLLIDTGIKGNYSRIVKTINGIGRSLEDLESIIITHADGDHYGSLYDLQKQTKAIAYATSVEAQAIKSGVSSRPLNPQGVQRLLFKLVSSLMKTPPARIDQILGGGETFDYLGGLEVIPTPGHTPEHISLYSGSTGILFAGDSIQVVNNEPQPSARSNTWDMAKAEESYRKQMDLKPDYILAGHSTWHKKSP